MFGVNEEIVVNKEKVEDLESIFNEEMIDKRTTVFNLSGKEFYPDHLDSCFMFLNGRWILRYVDIEPFSGSLSYRSKPKVVVMNGMIYAYRYLYKEIESVVFEKKSYC